LNPLNPLKAAGMALSRLYHRRMSTKPVDTAIELSRVRRLVRSGHARRIREEAQLSQGEVAKIVGVTSAAVSRWESGDRMPQGEAAIRYGELLRSLL